MLLGCEEGLTHSHDPKLLQHGQNQQTMSKGLESRQMLQYNVIYKQIYLQKKKKKILVFLPGLKGKPKVDELPAEHKYLMTTKLPAQQ